MHFVPYDTLSELAVPRQIVSCSGDLAGNSCAYAADMPAIGIVNDDEDGLLSLPSLFLVGSGNFTHMVNCFELL